jgi:subtilase family serine protease
MRTSKRGRTGPVVLICLVALGFFSIPAAARKRSQVLHKHVRPAVTNGQAARVGPMPKSQRLRLAIVLPLRNQSELTNLLRRLYDPSSPDYRHFLTVAQFTQQFSPTQQDYQAVVKFARSKGFRVTDTPANRLLVHINGTVSQINKAFHVAMTTYRHPTVNRTFYSPDREPSLDLSVPVTHIAGLNNFSLPRPTFQRAPPNFRRNSIGSGPSGAYLGSDMRAAYYLDPA